MGSIVAIVEGDGEVAALPVLLRRIVAKLDPSVYIDIPTPIRVRRDRFLNKDEEFHRHLQLAASKAKQNGFLLVLLDADDDCPVDLANKIYSRMSKVVRCANFGVVLANREYEAWFIAAAESLSGCRGFLFAGSLTINPDTPRDAKRWISERMESASYKEVTDQPAFSAQLDLDVAISRSRSLRKLCAEIERYLDRIKV